MKYIVTLRKVLEKKVVVEAEDTMDVDQKLLAGATAFEAVRTVSDDCYLGWEYRPQKEDGVDQNCLPVYANDTVICNLEDFAKWFGCDNVKKLKPNLFKNTTCGMCYSATKDSITLVGYVEGADCDHPSEILVTRLLVVLPGKSSPAWRKKLMRCGTNGMTSARRATDEESSRVRTP